MLDYNQTAAELPLGRGPDIRLADFYTVRYGDHRETSGARVLVIETDKPLQIRPTQDPNTVIIAAAS
jgi:hypothetical protein